MILNIKKLRPNAKLPAYAHDGDSGMDLHAAETCTIKAGARRVVPTGISVEVCDGLPPNMRSDDRKACEVRPRSGNSARGLDVILGTIDRTFTGEVGALVVNNTGADVTIREGDRIAQLVVVVVPASLVREVHELSVTDRGPNGWGSTGS